MMNMTYTLLLLLGFSVGVNLIILRKYWVTSTLLDSLVRLLDTLDILALARDGLVLNLTRKPENIKSQFQLARLLLNRPSQSSTTRVQESSEYSNTKLLNVSRKTVN